MPKEVYINGVRYVPASEISVDIREVIARAVADLYWDIPKDCDDWELEFNKRVGAYPIIVTDDSSWVDDHTVTCADFLDKVTAALHEIEEEG